MWPGTSVYDQCFISHRYVLTCIPLTLFIALVLCIYIYIEVKYHIAGKFGGGVGEFGILSDDSSTQISTYN